MFKGSIGVGNISLSGPTSVYVGVGRLCWRRLLRFSVGAVVRGRFSPGRGWCGCVRAASLGGLQMHGTTERL